MTAFTDVDLVLTGWNSPEPTTMIGKPSSNRTMTVSTLIVRKTDLVSYQLNKTTE